MYTLATETAQDWWEVESLYDLFFAPGREALSSYRLRDEVDPIADLCLTARDPDGVLGGAIRYWPVRISSTRALLLGPIAVHPTRQGEGLGRTLINDSMKRARDLGWQRVMLVGDAPYYSKFGFKPLKGVLMPPPTNPDRVLGHALTPNAWDNVSGKVAPDA